MSEDPRKTAARLKYQRQPEPLRDDPEESAQRSQTAHVADEHLRSAVVEGALQQALRRGDFDNLPGFGKPLEGLEKADDPDWWIRDKIEKEHLTGIAPPALTLRNENRLLDDRLDGLTSESRVREELEDFNARIKQARFQPRGGPPVITPLRNVDAEVVAWQERRAHRSAQQATADVASPNSALTKDPVLSKDPARAKDAAASNSRHRKRRSLFAWLLRRDQ